MPRKRAAKRANRPGSRVVNLSKIEKEEPREPKVTAQEWPMSAVAAAKMGSNPRPTSNGAATATGAP